MIQLLSVIMISDIKNIFFCCTFHPDGWRHYVWKWIWRKLRIRGRVRLSPCFSCLEVFSFIFYTYKYMYLYIYIILFDSLYNIPGKYLSCQSLSFLAQWKKKNNCSGVTKPAGSRVAVSIEGELSFGYNYFLLLYLSLFSWFFLYLLALPLWGCF